MNTGGKRASRSARHKETKEQRYQAYGHDAAHIERNEPGGLPPTAARMHQ
jgi:hypothetical protein